MHNTIRIEKNKVLMKLICAFVFAYAKCWFSHDAAHVCLLAQTTSKINNLVFLWYRHSNIYRITEKINTSKSTMMDGL